MEFPGVLANDDVSLDIRKGEVFALVGENGAGKTTLMNILYGIHEPTNGEVYIRGRKGRALLAQNRHLYGRRHGAPALHARAQLHRGTEHRYEPRAAQARCAL